MTKLVELAVVRYMGFWHDAEDFSLRDHGRAIVAGRPARERKPDDDRGGKLFRFAGYAPDRVDRSPFKEFLPE